MIGLDCNILVQLALADHPKNASTIAAVGRELQQGETLTFPSLIITEFLHVVSDPRRFAPPLTEVEALDWIEQFLSNSAVSVLEPNAASLGEMFGWMRQFHLGRKRILDTHLAAILHAHGVRRLMTSNSRDFAIFDVFEIVTP